MTRQAKTPGQRAQEALGIAQRRVSRIETDQKKAKAALELLQKEYAQAVARRDYLAQNPDLPQAPVSAGGQVTKADTSQVTT